MSLGRRIEKRRYYKSEVKVHKIRNWQQKKFQFFVGQTNQIREIQFRL